MCCAVLLTRLLNRTQIHKYGSAFKKFWQIKDTAMNFDDADVIPDLSQMPSLTK